MELLTTSEVAELEKVTNRQVCRNVNKDKYPDGCVYKLKGGHFVFNKELITKYIENKGK